MAITLEDIKKKYEDTIKRESKIWEKAGLDPAGNQACQEAKLIIGLIEEHYNNIKEQLYNELYQDITLQWKTNQLNDQN